MTQLFGDREVKKFNNALLHKKQPSANFKAFKLKFDKSALLRTKKHN